MADVEGSSDSESDRSSEHATGQESQDGDSESVERASDGEEDVETDVVPLAETTSETVTVATALQNLTNLVAGLQASGGNQRIPGNEDTDTQATAVVVPGTGAEGEHALEEETVPAANDAEVTTHTAPGQRPATRTRTVRSRTIASRRRMTRQPAARDAGTGTVDLAAVTAALQQLTTVMNGMQQPAVTAVPNSQEAAVDMAPVMTAIRYLTDTVSRLQLEPARSVQGGHTRRKRPKRSHHGRPAAGGQPSDSDNSSDESSSSDYRRHDDESDGSGGGSSGSSSAPGSDGSGSEGSSDESGREHHHTRRGRDRYGRRVRHGRHRHHRRRLRRRSVRDLELPTFTPSPKVSVSTWIDRVDLALKGAREAGRGTWSDHSLYFILGNKLMENAAKWWVNMDRKSTRCQRTWTYLKKALLRRYGERLDKSAAEWRVSMRRMLPGETYADFGAGLRDVVGRNRVSERVLLAQFFRCLDKTTRKLVKQDPKPKTLEEAVDKATEIDDPMDNVAQGMMNIGQPWATAPSPYLIPMAGTTGQTAVIPGIGGTGLPSEILATGAGGSSTTSKDATGVALFTNPQGVFNDYSGTWDVPPGRVWNGKFWAETRKSEKKKPKSSRLHDSKKTEKKSKSKRDLTPPASSGDESEPQPKRPKLKAAVKQVSERKSNAPARTSSTTSDKCFRCGQEGHWAPVCPNTNPNCYACHKPGHFAKDCPDPEAKARNDKYLRQRKPREESKVENE